MRVGLIHTKDTPRGRYLLEMFGRGALKHNDKIEHVENGPNVLKQLKLLDVGVQICIANRHHKNSPTGKFRLAVSHAMRRWRKRIVTIDSGFVHSQGDIELEMRRQGSKKGNFDVNDAGTFAGWADKIYYGVGYDGIKRDADYCLGKVSSDRWDRLGVKLQPWRSEGDHILLIGQTLHGLSSQQIDIYQWYRNVVRELRKKTKRRIVFRHHPRVVRVRDDGSRGSKESKTLARIFGDVKGVTLSQNLLLADDLVNAWAVVVFTSNAAVPAALAGIPLFVMDKTCMAFSVGNHHLGDIERPGMPDRTKWAWQLAHSQWTPAEMAAGLVWKVLRPHASLAR